MSLFYTITSFFELQITCINENIILFPHFQEQDESPIKHVDMASIATLGQSVYTPSSTILMCCWVLYSCAIEYYTHVLLSTILMCGWVLYCDFDWLYLTSMWANLPIRINIAPSFITYEYNNITMPLRVFLMVRSKNPLLLIDTLQKLFISKRKVLYTEYYQIENNSLLLRC